MEGFPTQACSNFGCLQILVHSKRTQNREKKTRSLNVEKTNRTQNITKKQNQKTSEKPNLGSVSLADGDGALEGRLETKREREL
jgi:alpha-L-fucosidase